MRVGRSVESVRQGEAVAFGMEGVVMGLERVTMDRDVALVVVVEVEEPMKIEELLVGRQERLREKALKLAVAGQAS